MRQGPADLLDNDYGYYYSDDCLRWSLTMSSWCCLASADSVFESQIAIDVAPDLLDRLRAVKWELLPVELGSSVPAKSCHQPAFAWGECGNLLNLGEVKGPVVVPHPSPHLMVNDSGLGR